MITFVVSKTKTNIMKTYLTSNNQNENVATAKSLLIDLGIDGKKLSFGGYSDTNGVSVYFFHYDYPEETQVRVSNHSISNASRMERTFCFGFDNAKSSFYSFSSKFDRNVKMAKHYKLIK